MITLSQVITHSKLHPTRVQNVYLFGSRVYGNASKSSDWDVIIIGKTPSPETELKSGDFNIHILSQDRFKDQLKQHHIRSLECIYSPDFATLKEDIKFDFQLNKGSLRHSISHINSNSWVKCKKKLEQGDYYIGIKSLWHSLRIPMFGTQIAQHGKITDFSCANHIWDELSSKDWSWDELNLKYKGLNNSLMSEFRLYASKF